MKDALTIVAIVLGIVDLWVTIVVLRSKIFAPVQKVLQLLIVWLIPLLGAILIYGIHLMTRPRPEGQGAPIGVATPAAPPPPPQDEESLGGDEKHLYQPLFVPWLAQPEFQQYYSLASRQTVVSVDRCYTLYTLLLQAASMPGDIWECGVYRGGTAAMMAAVLAAKFPSKRLYLFDTFQGMPKTDPSNKDWHKEGDFSDTSLEAVKSYVGYSDTCIFKPGFIPDTFAGLEANQIALAHIDVDTYHSVLDSLAFVWPRLSVGGVIVFDDYGFPTCRGARKAVDEFFASDNHRPLCLATGQAIVFKS